MSIAAISNGENALSVREKLNSGISKINYLSFPENSNLSYIDPLMGSDTSGNGSFANPYKSIGAAYSGGSVRYMLMPGDAGVLDIPPEGEGNTNFSIYGIGGPYFWPSESSSDFPFSQSFQNSFEAPSKVLIKNNNATTSHIHVSSNNAVLISLSGVASSSLGAGIEAAFYNSTLGNLILNGLNGANGENGQNGGTDENGTNGENGSDGGPAGIVYLGYCTVAGSITMVGGNGGSGGNGGNGGIPEGEDANGLDGGNGGNGGLGGQGGTLVVHYSRILGDVNLSVGNGGSMGSGGLGSLANGMGSNGFDGSDGNNGSNGSSSPISSAYSMFTEAPVGTGVPQLRFSMIGGNII